MSHTNISECSFLPIYIKRLAISALVCSLLQMVNISYLAIFLFPFFPFPFNLFSYPFPFFFVTNIPKAFLDYLLLHTAYRFVKSFLLQLTFPNDNYRPIPCFKLSPDFLVSLLIPRNLLDPKLGVRLGDGVFLTAFVSVPEASVNEHHRTMLRKYEIGGTRQPFVVLPVSESPSPQLMSQLHFRLGRRGTDSGHVAMTLVWSEDVGHQTTKK